jgi:hypothetical protein
MRRTVLILIASCVWRKNAEEGEVHRYLEVAPPS